MWVWLSLLLGVCVEATSNGVGMVCDVNYPGLGSMVRDKVNKNLTMSWVWPPAFAGEQYTLRTADPSTASDPKGYVPGQWLSIYIRTTKQDQQFTGLALYATNKDNLKVGKWTVPPNSPFHVTPAEECVVHSNADPKHYLSVFKFQGPPVGTGIVTIKALVKFGLAFPNPTGNFWWPNNAHLTLTELPQTSAPAWYEGEVGESCITVCTKRNLGCDLPYMKIHGNSSAMLPKVAAFSNCTGPVMPGCSSASPSVGTAGCFYHSSSCEQPPVVPLWQRSDICANLSDFSMSVAYCQNSNPRCSKYKGSKWCCNNFNAGYPPDDPQSANNVVYGPWGVNQGGGNKGPCMPVGGWPPAQGTVIPPARVFGGKNEITCEATKRSPLDGQRICACSSTGQRYANSASRAGLPLAVFLVSVFASF